MNIEIARASLEAVLFAGGEPMEVSRLAQALEMDEETVTRLAAMLAESYDTSGSALQLIQLGSSYQLTTRAEFAEPIRRALEIKRNTPLSNAAMEVLTIIAYNQPVTKGFVERVRGVDSSSTVNTLVERGLLEEAGRIEVPGRPVTYRTTAQFLRCFGLQSLADLPPLPNAEEPTMFDLSLEEALAAADENAEDPMESAAEETDNLETVEAEPDSEIARE